MVTHGDSSTETFTAGFRFMHKMRDPGFRAFLKQHGWMPGGHVVMASEDEPAIDVMARILLHDTGGRAMVAIADNTQKYGFKLLSITVGHPPRKGIFRRRVETINIDPSADIGMLYSAFDRCGEYVPSEWSAPVTVRKEPESVRSGRG